MDLRVENTGDPLKLIFAPEIPFSAKLIGAIANGKSVPVQAQDNEQDTHGRVELSVGHGETDCTIRYWGGIQLSLAKRHLLPGQSSQLIKLTGMWRQGKDLLLSVDVLGAGQSSIELRTTEKIMSVDGATWNQLSDDQYSLSVPPTQTGIVPDNLYRHAQITVHLAPESPKAR
jgi:hypothetical protein